MKRMKLMAVVMGLTLLALAARAQWEPAKRLTYTSGDTYRPRIAVDSAGSVHVVWFDYTPGASEIYYKKSSDGGGAWSAPKRLTWTSGNSQRPAVAVGDPDVLHLVWNDYTPGNSEIYYRKSVNSGATWSTAKRLTWNSGESGSPVMAADSNGYLHLLWDDSTPGDSEIFYRKSTDGGITWTPLERLTWNAGESWSPDIAVYGSDNFHVVWYDTTPGNYEIYYKRQK